MTTAAHTAISDDIDAVKRANRWLVVLTLAIAATLAASALWPPRQGSGVGIDAASIST